jgi:hypothetical protein
VLVVPTFWLAKFKLVDERLTAGLKVLIEYRSSMMSLWPTIFPSADAKLRDPPTT